jgi:hypothetical protein
MDIKKEIGNSVGDLINASVSNLVYASVCDSVCYTVRHPVIEVHNSVRSSVVSEIKEYEYRK